MTASLATKLSIAIKATSKNPQDLVTPESVLDLIKSWTLPDGTGSGQARKLWSDERSLAASATESIDFSGSLTDALGVALVLTKAAIILIFADAANPGIITVGGNAAEIPYLGNPTSDVINIQAGGAAVLIAGPAGYVVTATTGDLLTWTAAATAGTYKAKFVVVGA